MILQYLFEKLRVEKICTFIQKKIRTFTQKKYVQS